jgi:hypothetical protein
MLKDDPEFNWAVDLLLSLKIDADDPPEELARKLDLAEPAFRYFGIRRESFLEVLFPPSEPVPPGQIMERIEAIARKLGYDLDDIESPAPSPPVSLDEIESTVRDAIQEALAASGKPMPDDEDMEKDWDDWDDLFDDGPDSPPDPDTGSRPPEM